LRTDWKTVLVLLALWPAACRQDMHDQPKYLPLQPSAFFDDGRASRPLVQGTVARGQLDDTSPSHTGKAGGTYLRRLPRAVTRPLLERGRERYDIFCSPCHDRTGYGGGMIVLRGFRRPPSFHQDRLREAADGYLFEVVSQGFGVMPSYASQVPVDDRWAIVAYVRALQLSQHAQLDDVPDEERARLEAEGQ
jgi:mono/diheme cytochrome c family protein